MIKRITVKKRNQLLSVCTKKCASIKAEHEKKRAEYIALQDKVCSPPPNNMSMATPSYHKCVNNLNNTSKAKAFIRLGNKLGNCFNGCAYKSGAWGNSLKNRWSDKLHRLKHTPAQKTARKPIGFLPMRGATLKNGKKVHTIFRITTVGKGKATSRKNGFYAVHCNKSDAPARKPDTYWDGDAVKMLKAYWFNRADIKNVKGSRKRDGSVIIKTKGDLDAFCGKNVSEY